MRVLPAQLNKDGRALSRLKGLHKSVSKLISGQSQVEPGAARSGPAGLLEYGNPPGGVVFWPANGSVANRFRSSGVVRYGLAAAQQGAADWPSACDLPYAGALRIPLSSSAVPEQSGLYRRAVARAEQIKLMDLGIAQSLLDLLPGGVISDVKGKRARLSGLAPSNAMAS